jgi:hypothetical protein
VDAFSPAVDLPAAEPGSFEKDMGNVGNLGDLGDTGGFGDMDGVIFPEKVVPAP